MYFVTGFYLIGPRRGAQLVSNMEKITFVVDSWTQILAIKPTLTPGRLKKDSKFTDIGEEAEQANRDKPSYQVQGKDE